MSDIRKRAGAKGTTYQVRYPDKSRKSGYTYATFDTLKEARSFVVSGKAQASDQALDRSVTTLPQAVDKWLKICEKEGTDGNEPVTTHTLKLYK
jgi:integrase